MFSLKQKREIIDFAGKYSLSAAGKIYNVHRHTIKKWIDQYEKGGPEALSPKNTKRKKLSSKDIKI